MTKTLSRKTLTAISREAHQTAWNTADLFGLKHKFEQGFVGHHGGLYVRHGFHDRSLDFVPISEVVVGERLRNKAALQQVQPVSLARLVRQSFAGGKIWDVRGTSVSTQSFIQPVVAFLLKYSEYFEVFAGIYENQISGTNVFGVVMVLKDVQGKDRLAWEITIDDADLLQRVVR